MLVKKDFLYVHTHLPVKCVSYDSLRSGIYKKRITSTTMVLIFSFPLLRIYLEFIFHDGISNTNKKSVAFLLFYKPMTTILQKEYMKEMYPCNILFSHSFFDLIFFCLFFLPVRQHGHAVYR